ncbi:MAG: hypothetical protein K9K79_06165 [Desulfohalobiaceae bacterium]|nr:hypothetical protein [Desulfohalobiaceae bacterium]
MGQVEKEHIDKTLKQTSGKISGRDGAAAMLQMPRTTLLYRMQKYGLIPKNYKQSQV